MKSSTARPDAPPLPAQPACQACRADAGIGFDITMALQPIVDLQERGVFAYEALVRGAVLQRVDERIRYNFDQTCRMAANSPRGSGWRKHWIAC
jgi:hypothetical protein